MNVLKKIIAVSSIVIALPCLVSCGERPVYVGTFVAVNNAIEESLVENDIAYTVEYPEQPPESGDKLAIYKIETEDTNAEIRVENIFSQYYVSFSLNDNAKDLEGEIYRLTNVMDIAYNGIYNEEEIITLDFLTDENNLVSSTQNQTVYGYERNSWSYKFIMREDGNTLTMTGQVWEEFTYM